METSSMALSPCVLFRFLGLLVGGENPVGGIFDDRSLEEIRIHSAVQAHRMSEGEILEIVLRQYADSHFLISLAPATCFRRHGEAQLDRVAVGIDDRLFQLGADVDAARIAMVMMANVHASPVYL
jgi:hypothetical protein